MCAFMCVFVYAFIAVCCVCLSLCMHASVCVCLCVCVCVCVWLRSSACSSKVEGMHALTHACAHGSVCVLVGDL